MNRSRAVFLFGIACSLALVALWVSGQSFWIDECNAAVKAIQPDIGAFWKKFSGMKGSDFQMPLYMFLLWCWEKIVGRGEFALRALNILFAWSAILLVASRRTLPRRLRLFWCLFAAVSPMLAAYMDEARPYALQFFAATALFLPFFSPGINHSIKTFDFRLFSIGILFLCASSLSGVVFAFWPCLWLLFRLVKEKTLWRFLSCHVLAVALDFVVLSVLGVFYLHTMLVGARASAAGGTTLATMAFCCYEFFGFSGIGPSRLTLRVAHASALRPYLLPLVSYSLVFLLFLGSVLCSYYKAGAANRKRDICNIRSVIILTTLGVLSMLLVGWVFGMRVLARHLMPVFPVFLFLCAGGGERIVRSVFSGYLPVFILLTALTVSSSQLRFSSRHAKDDYRRAAAMAESVMSEAKCVWWAADGAAAEFYGIGERETFFRLMNPRQAELDQLSVPDIIFFSKPDLYDANGCLRNWCSAHSFVTVGRLGAFEILARSSDQ